MNKRIKYIVLVGIIMIPAGIRAQNIADTAKVNIAFRQVCKKDLMGGISAMIYKPLSVATTENCGTKETPLFLLMACLVITAIFQLMK